MRLDTGEIASVPALLRPTPEKSAFRKLASAKAGTLGKTRFSGVT
jgi:hypothetical protein